MAPLAMARTGGTHKDRRRRTVDAPQAASNLGRLAAQAASGAPFALDDVAAGLPPMGSSAAPEVRRGAFGVPHFARRLVPGLRYLPITGRRRATWRAARTRSGRWPRRRCTSARRSPVRSEPKPDPYRETSRAAHSPMYDAAPRPGGPAARVTSDGEHPRRGAVAAPPTLWVA